VWIDEDATTLWEKWDININSDSKNHHMYSDFMSWIIKKIGGVSINEEKPGELEFVFEPYIFEEINNVKLKYHIACGDINVKLIKNDKEALIYVKKDKQVKLVYAGKLIEDECEIRISTESGVIA